MCWLPGESRDRCRLTADYQRYESSGEINFTVTTLSACVEAVEIVRNRIVSIDHLDGVTVDLGDDSWFNLRSSNTEPLLRLIVASCVGVDAGYVSRALKSLPRAHMRRPDRERRRDRS